MPVRQPLAGVVGEEQRRPERAPFEQRPHTHDRRMETHRGGRCDHDARPPVRRDERVDDAWIEVQLGERMEAPRHGCERVLLVAIRRRRDHDRVGLVPRERLVEVRVDVDPVSLAGFSPPIFAWIEPRDRPGFEAYKVPDPPLAHRAQPDDEDPHDLGSPRALERIGRASSGHDVERAAGGARGQYVIGAASALRHVRRRPREDAHSRHPRPAAERLGRSRRPRRDDRRTGAASSGHRDRRLSRPRAARRRRRAPVRRRASRRFTRSPTPRTSR